MLYTLHETGYYGATPLRLATSPTLSVARSSWLFSVFMMASGLLGLAILPIAIFHDSVR